MKKSDINTNPEKMSDEEVEIDLRELIFAFKRHLLLIILVAFLGGGTGYFISKMILKPVYTSTSIIYIMSKETTLTQLTDLQIGTQLTQDYMVLVKSRTVMQNTVDGLGLNINYVQLRNKINISNPANTRILDISVEDGDPVMAKTLTDEVAKNASRYIAEIMEQDPPKIVETGEIPIYKTRPNTKNNTVIGALIGIFIVLGIVTIKTVTNDTIKTEDDIDRYFSTPVLAVIPFRKSDGGDRKKRHRIKGNNKIPDLKVVKDETADRIKDDRTKSSVTEAGKYSDKDKALADAKDTEQDLAETKDTGQTLAGVEEGETAKKETENEEVTKIESRILFENKTESETEPETKEDTRTEPESVTDTKDAKDDTDLEQEQIVTENIKNRDSEGESINEAHSFLEEVVFGDEEKAEGFDDLNLEIERHMAFVDSTMEKEQKSNTVNSMNEFSKTKTDVMNKDRPETEGRKKPIMSFFRDRKWQSESVEKQDKDSSGGGEKT